MDTPRFQSVEQTSRRTIGRSAPFREDGHEPIRGDSRLWFTEKQSLLWWRGSPDPRMEAGSLGRRVLAAAHVAAMMHLAEVTQRSLTDPGPRITEADEGGQR